MDVSTIKIEEEEFNLIEDEPQPVNTQLIDTTEPVIDFSLYVRQERDPLSNEDFTFVPINNLIRSEPVVEEPTTSKVVFIVSMLA
jgi:hypothetical protein